MQIQRIAIALAVPIGAFGLAACGGDGGGAAKSAPNADTLVAQASGPNPAARSGRIDGRITIALKGAPGFEAPFSATINGPFSYRDGAALPDYDIVMSVRNYRSELTSVGGRSYVSLGTTGYRLPARVRDRLVQSSARGANGLTRTLEQYGLAPWRWETDRRVAGTARIDGVDVVHITTSFTAGRILRDANTLLGLFGSLGVGRATGLPAQLSVPVRRAIVAGVGTKVGASWIGAADKVLRRAAFTMTFAIPAAQRARLGAISSGVVSGRLNVSSIGVAQHIAAPRTLKPFSQFAGLLSALGDARAQGSR